MAMPGNNLWNPLLAYMGGTGFDPSKVGKYNSPVQKISKPLNAVEKPEAQGLTPQKTPWMQQEAWGGFNRGDLLMGGLGMLAGRNFQDGIANLANIAGGAMQRKDKKTKEDKMRVAITDAMRIEDPKERQNALLMAMPEIAGPAAVQQAFTPQQTQKPLVVNDRVLDPNDPSNVLADYSDPDGPLSPAGKLASDLANDVITQDQYDAEIQRLNKPGLSVTNTVGGKAESSFQTARAGAASDQWDQIIEAGRAADVTLSDANTMNFLLDQVDYTGFGGETLLTAQKLGQMVGLDVGSDVPAKEAMQRLTAKLGLALKSDLPGPMSDGDRQFLLSIPPNLSVTRAGNKALVFMSRKRAQFDADMAASLIERNPKTLDEYRAWENEFRRNYPPLFDEGTMRDLQMALSGELDG